MVVKMGKVAPKKAAVKKAPALERAVVEKKKTLPKAKALKKSVLQMPEILRDTALKVLDVRKAENIMLIDLKGRSPLADYMIIASGGSGRQISALAEYLREAFVKAGHKRVRTEGQTQGDWVLVDAGDVLVHLFRAEVRGYYQIEEIWEDQ